MAYQETWHNMYGEKLTFTQERGMPTDRLDHSDIADRLVVTGRDDRVLYVTDGEPEGPLPEMATAARQAGYVKELTPPGNAVILNEAEKQWVKACWMASRFTREAETEEESR